MKIQTVFRRYEIKYLIKKEQREQILSTLSGRLRADEFGHSTICNLYYDTSDYLLVRRSLEQPQYKEKLRLRSYGTAKADDKVYAEIKRKYDGVVYKRRIGLPASESGRLRELPKKADTQIAKEIAYFFSRYPSLAPRVYLSYERDAFYDAEDPALRMTFDENILFRNHHLSLSRPPDGIALLSPDTVLMELKCGGALPLYIVKLLSEMKLYKTSFSKYGTVYRVLFGEGKTAGEEIRHA